MLPIHGLHRNPFRFLITPPTLVVSDVYFPLDQAPAAFWNFVRSDGGDVRVLKQDGVTPVPFQIVGFNSTTKVGQLYIKASSATAFYVYFGNRQFTGLAATDTYGRRAVWETAAVLVMHGEDVTDSSSYNNSNVSATPPTSAAGTIGNGMQFNGTTQYADMGNAAVLQILGNMSIMCWVHPITIATSYRQILGKDYNIYYPAPYDYYINPTTGKLAFYRGDGTPGNAVGIVSTNGISQDTVHHVAVAMAGTSATHYLDGGTNGTGTISTTIADKGTGLRIGKRTDAQSMYGNIDEIRVYNRALSGAEVAQHYANQNAPASFWTVAGSLEQV